MRDKFLKTLVIVLAFSRCAVGPKRENDSAVAHLNGNNYQQKANILGVPVFERQPIQVKISGQVLVDQTPFPEPLRNQTLVLKSGTRELLRALSDSQGEFTFSGNLPNGIYQVVLISERYKAQQTIKVDDYNIGNVTLMANRF